MQLSRQALGVRVKVNNAPNAGRDDVSCTVMAGKRRADELAAIYADAKTSCSREGVHLGVYSSTKLCKGAEPGALYGFEKYVQLCVWHIDGLSLNLLATHLYSSGCLVEHAVREPSPLRHPDEQLACNASLPLGVGVHWWLERKVTAVWLVGRPIKAPSSTRYLIRTDGHNITILRRNRCANLSAHLSTPQCRRVCEVHRVLIASGWYEGLLEDQLDDAAERLC